MLLPPRLFYDETEGLLHYGTEVVREWWPVVRCTVTGCEWVYDALWEDLGWDGDVDWDKAHPLHDNGAMVTVIANPRDETQNAKPA